MAGTEGSSREGAVRGDVRIWDLARAVRRERFGEGVVERRVVMREADGSGMEAFARAVLSWVVRVRSIVCVYACFCSSELDEVEQERLRARVLAANNMLSAVVEVEVKVVASRGGEQ